jgi:hypothetical protein
MYNLVYRKPDRHMERSRPQVRSQTLIDTAHSLVADDEGMLAMDESTSTRNKRFASLGISQSEQNILN